jgi:hypothetical protein
MVSLSIKLTLYEGIHLSCINALREPPTLCRVKCMLCNHLYNILHRVISDDCVNYRVRYSEFPTRGGHHVISCHTYVRERVK